MRVIIRARTVALYDRRGLAAFQVPGVQLAIGLLLDAGEGPAAIRRLRRAADAGDGRPRSGYTRPAQWLNPSFWPICSCVAFGLTRTASITAAFNAVEILGRPMVSRPAVNVIPARSAMRHTVE